MTLKPVKTPEEALSVALIRNECKQWMTNDATNLDVGRQLKFFKSLKKREDLRLFIARENGVPCGYGLIRIENNTACLTGGLALPFRGRGLGRSLFNDLVSYALDLDLKPWLTVLKSNRRAIKLYRGIGFTTVEKQDRLLLMEYTLTTTER